MTQIVLFLGLVFGVTWPTLFRWRPPAAPESVWAFLAPLLPVFWAPTVIALVLIGSTEGARGLRRELRARLSYTRGTLRWFVIAGVVPVIAVATAVASGRAAGHDASFIPLTAIPPMIGVQLITGAVGEELGWRGFLLPRLGQRIGRMQAALAMAILWSIWHAPAFFTPGMPHQVMPMPLTLAFIALFGLFMAFVFDRTGESVLATMLAHLCLNIASGIGGVELSSPVFWGVLVAIFGLLAVVVVIISRARLQAKQ